jgi:phage-related protein
MVTIDDVIKRVLEAWNKFEDWLSAGLASLSGFFAGLFSELQTGIESLFNTFIQGIEDLRGIIEGVANDARSWVDSLSSEVSAWFDEALTSASNAYSDAVNYAEALFSGVEDAARDAAADLVSGVQGSVDALSSTVDDVRGGIDEVSGALTSLITDFDSWVQTSLEYLLNLFIEKETESEKYRNEAQRS